MASPWKCIHFFLILFKFYWKQKRTLTWYTLKEAPTAAHLIAAISIDDDGLEAAEQLVDDSRFGRQNTIPQLLAETGHLLHFYFVYFYWNELEHCLEVIHLVFFSLLHNLKCISVFVIYAWWSCFSF